MKDERNLAVCAVPAASTKGSTGRQHVATARTLLTAQIAAAPRKGFRDRANRRNIYECWYPRF
jgi:hypothetical protein